MQVEVIRKQLEQVRAAKLKYEAELVVLQQEKARLVKEIESLGETEASLPQAVNQLTSEVEETLKEIKIPHDLLSRQY